MNFPNEPQDYRVEVWFTYPKVDAEDEIEEQFRDFMKHNDMVPQGGPVAFRIFRH